MNEREARLALSCVVEPATPAVTEAIEDHSRVEESLAVVVMGGLITSTLLTLVVLPVLYGWVEERRGVR